ncbi:hypothetical protein [Deinococcus hopiensis]|uniref:hypothetical protein n=1 Tax=Deinococcus hopiensis TaxID=309885 RepID=UPI000A008DBB|nr:hypothetical protein [Deinococcus hopiensis]
MPEALQAWVDMASFHPNGGFPEHAWGLVWREAGSGIRRTGTFGGPLPYESELLAVQFAAQHLAQLHGAGTVRLHCDDLRTVRRIGGLTTEEDANVPTLRMALTRWGIELVHGDRETTPARAAHQQARFTLAALSRFPGATRLMRNEAETELPRLLQAVARSIEVEHSRFHRGGLMVQVSLDGGGCASEARETVRLSVQKGDRGTVSLWSGPLDEAPELVRKIVDELSAAERERVQERFGRESSPTTPEQLRTALGRLLQDHGVDGLPTGQVSQLLKGVEAATLQRLAAAWPEVEVYLVGSKPWVRLRRGQNPEP